MTLGHSSTAEKGPPLVSGEELCADLDRGRFQHVVLLVGSAVSGRGPSACAMVSTIRGEMILEPLRKRFLSAADPLPKAIGGLLERILGQPESNPCAQAIADLPFEQFMSCLERVDAHIAHAVISLACRGGDRFQPNFQSSGTG